MYTKTQLCITTFVVFMTLMTMQCCCAVETVDMTDALVQQPYYQVAASKHGIVKTFKIIQSHGEQVGSDHAALF